MARLIEADKEIVEIKNMKLEGEVNTTAQRFAMMVLQNAPTVDAVPRIEVDKAFQDGYEKGYHRAQLDYGLEDDLSSCGADRRMTKEQAKNYLRSSGFSEEQINEVVKALEPTTKNDLVLIHTEGLDEEIRCTMCTNYMKSDRGCDGSCVVNKDTYKAVMDTIEKRIQPTTKNDLVHNLCDSCTNIGCEFQSGIVRTECAFYMPPHLESDNCGNYIIQEDCISRQAVIDLMMQKWGENFSGDDAMQESIDAIRVLPSVTPQEPTDKCKWIKYDHRTMCPKEHDVDSPYWRIPENRMETLKYCPYCGKEIEVEV